MQNLEVDFSYKDPYFFLFYNKDQQIKIINGKNRKHHNFGNRQYKTAFLISSDYILCQSDNGFDFYDRNLDFVCSCELKVEIIKPCSYKDSTFFALSQNCIYECYLEFNQDTNEVQMITSEILIPDISDQILDFAVSCNYYVILLKSQILIKLKNDPSSKKGKTKYLIFVRKKITYNHFVFI